MWRLVRRGAMAHWSRLGLTAIGIAAAVAFLTAVLVATTALSSGVDRLFGGIYAPADLYVRGRTGATSGFDAAYGGQRAPVDAATVARIRAVPGVTAVEGRVLERTTILGTGGQHLDDRAVPPTFGADWPRSPGLSGWRLVAGREPVRATDAVLSAGAAARHHVGIGDRISVVGADGAPHRLIVRGLARFRGAGSYGGSTVVLTEVTRAQSVFGSPGTYTWVSVDVAADAPPVREAVAATAGDRVMVEGRGAMVAQAVDTFGTYVAMLRRLLLVFALVTLVVGACTIVNTVSVTVAQRRRELALLRALGASRVQVVAGLVGEVALVAAGAAAIGAVVGGGIGLLVAARFESGGIVPPGTVGMPAPGDLGAPILVAVALAAAAAAIPAWRASGVAPTAALRDAAVPAARPLRRRLAAGLAIDVAGLALVAAGLVARPVPSTGLVAGGLAVLVAGLALLTLPGAWSALSRALTWPFVRTGDVVWRLARDNVVRAPARSGLVGATLMLGVVVVVMFSVMAGSLGAAAEESLSGSVHADLVLHADLARGGMVDGRATDRVRRVPGVAAATGVRVAGGEVDDVSVRFVGADPEALARVVDVALVHGSFALGRDGVAVSERDARAHGWGVGDRVVGEFVATGYEDLHVVAIYRGSLPLGTGAVVLLGRTGFDRRVRPDQRGDALVLISTAPGGDVAAVRDGIGRALVDRPYLRVDPVDAYARAQAEPGLRVASVVEVLLAVAVVVSALGIADSLLLAVQERRAEIGILRAIGLARRSAAAMVRREAAVIGLVGAASGVLVGIPCGWALARTVADGRPVPLSIPVAPVGVAGVAAVALAVAAASFAARRAARLAILAAIAAP